jgi:hypothetical protein
MPSRMVKIKATIPAHLENSLVNHWGYAVEHRIHNDYILFKKSYISDKGKSTANDDGVKRTIRASVDKPTVITGDNILRPNFKDQLSKYQKTALAKRCDNIVMMFPDPYAVPESVRARLKVVMQRMTLPEAQFVLDYMDENFPIVDIGE